MHIAELLFLSLLMPSSSIALHAQAPSDKRSQARDTLPEHVVARGDDAFNKQDGAALAALYAPDAVGSYFTSDSMAGPRPWGPDSVLAGVQRYWASQKRSPHIRVAKRMSNGPFVVVLYDFTEDAGTKSLLEVYEVRQGSIVHEWSQR